MVLKISYMRTVLIRGGESYKAAKPILLKEFVIVDSIKTPMIHPYLAQFTANCKITINNMFQEHIARRYLQGSAQKIKTVAPTYLAPMASASTKVNAIGLIGWTCLGVGLISFAILGSLYLFKNVKHKHIERECQHNIVSEPFFLFY